MSYGTIRLVCLLAIAPAFASDACGDWPCWRGPKLDGSGAGSNAPIVWSEKLNVAWKSLVPGRGHSSAIVVGDRIILTTAEELPQRQYALCFDRKTGQRIWETTVHQGGFMPCHLQNSQASATPASDGRRIFTVFMNSGKLFVTALDLEGRKAWQNEVGPFDLSHQNEGYGSSPVLYRSLVIINGDNRREGFIAAFECDTGRVVWRQERPNLGSFGTPTVAALGGRAQLILSGNRTVDSYDPMTGQRLWWCKGTAEATANTMAFGEQFVFASGGAPEKEILCVRADGSGDVNETHVVWRTNRGVTYVPSPIYHDQHLYLVTDGGIARCLEADSGKVAWENRLGGNFKSSPVRQANRIYICNESGKTFVLKTGAKFELIAENTLEEGAFASPAVCERQIFHRTYHYLYCIEEPTRAVGAPRNSGD